MISTLVLGADPEAALALARTAEQAQAWWQKISGADAWLAVAAARDARGDRAGAVAAWRSARALLEDVVRNTSATTVLRRRARVAALLALETRDRALADEALTWYRRAGGYDAMIVRLSW